MSPQEKICTILRRLHEKNAISPYPGQVKFDFVSGVWGAGILSDEEERQILLKLEKEGVLKINVHAESELEERQQDEYSHDQLVMMSGTVYVELLEKFKKRYQECPARTRASTSSSNSWNYVNPFWLLWIFFNLVRRYKFFAIIMCVLTFLTADYVTAGKNIQWVRSLLGM